MWLAAVAGTMSAPVMIREPRAMWTCPACGRRFASRGQVHTCRTPGSVEERRAAMRPEVRQIFDVFVSAVTALGPVEIIAEKSRLAFHARMTFAMVVPRQRTLNGHLVLAELVDDPHFHRATTYSVHNHVHEFRLHSPEEIDATMRRHIAAAYDVGMQRHHRS